MVESTSDERTVNNVARHEYRILSDDEKASVRTIKDKGLEFIELCNSIEKVGFANRPTRMKSYAELASARMKIEEAIMWAVKAVTA